MSSTPALDSFTSQLVSFTAFLSETFHKIPGSPIITRYIASSYQNDPFRSLLELFLLAFAIRTLFQSRTRASTSGSNFVKLDDKVRQGGPICCQRGARRGSMSSRPPTPTHTYTQEIDELVSEFNPVPLCEPLSPAEADELASVPTIIGASSPKPKISVPGLHNGKPKEVANLASYNFADLAASEKVKEAAIKTLRTYGVGSCSPPGFYGTIGECAGYCMGGTAP